MFLVATLDRVSSVLRCKFLDVDFYGGEGDLLLGLIRTVCVCIVYKGLADWRLFGIERKMGIMRMAFFFIGRPQYIRIRLSGVSLIEHKSTCNLCKKFNRPLFKYNFFLKFNRFTVKLSSKSMKSKHIEIHTKNYFLTHFTLNTNYREINNAEHP